MENQSYLILVINTDKHIITAETLANKDSANECFDENVTMHPASQVLMVPTLRDSDYE